MKDLMHAIFWIAIGFCLSVYMGGSVSISIPIGDIVYKLLLSLVFGGAVMVSGGCHDDTSEIKYLVLGWIIMIVAVFLVDLV